MSENYSCKEIEIMFGGAPSQTSAARQARNKPTETAVFPFFFLFFLHFRTGFVEEKNVDFETKERRRANCGETHGTGHR